MSLFIRYKRISISNKDKKKRRAVRFVSFAIISVPSFCSTS